MPYVCESEDYMYSHGLLLSVAIARTRRKLVMFPVGFRATSEPWIYSAIRGRVSKTL